MKCLMILGALLAASFSSSAYAWDCNYWSQSSNPAAECYKTPVAPATHNNNTNKNHNLAISKSISQGGAGGAGGSAEQHQGQQEQQQQAEQQQQSADNAGNQQISNYNAPRIPVNTAIAGIGITTAGCRFAEGLGVQTSPAGASVGFSFKDKDCERFAVAQYLYSRGQNAAADRILCKIKTIYDALGADCLTLIAVQPPALPQGQAQVLINTTSTPTGLLWGCSNGEATCTYPPGESERRQKEHGFPKVQK